MNLSDLRWDCIFVTDSSNLDNSIKPVICSSFRGQKGQRTRRVMCLNLTQVSTPHFSQASPTNSGISVKPCGFDCWRGHRLFLTWPASGQDPPTAHTLAKHSSSLSGELPNVIFHCFKSSDTCESRTVLGTPGCWVFVGAEAYWGERAEQDKRDLTARISACILRRPAVGEEWGKASRLHVYHSPSAAILRDCLEFPTCFSRDQLLICWGLCSTNSPTK